ncbi:MAG: NHLP bacteriocin system secretion protein [Acidobacteriia bacterium]|nr:NHLP bacteriocin system secretion protein [Terriglobia bacterium]
MDPQHMFRKAALEKLSSPERLDVMMQVTSPMGWLALWTIGAVLAAVIVWSVVGSISIKVAGKGILIRGGSVLDLATTGSGRISEILVKPGDDVSEGQLVARVTQSDLMLRIQNVKEEIAALSGQGVEQQAAQSRITARYRQEADELRQKISVQQEMVAKGLLTKSALMATQQQLTATEQQIAQGEMSSAGRMNRVDDLRRQLRQLDNQLASSSEVRSTYTGRVLEVATAPGDLVSAGQRLITLEASNAPIKAVIYIPAGEGKKVRPSMPAYISPSTVKAEEYGFMIGEVKAVSDYPMTPQGLEHVLRNPALVSELTGGTAPIEVNAALIPDSTTPSGFRWSSSKGPPVKIFSGTICSATITVETKRPISYVLPIFRKTIGIT